MNKGQAFLLWSVLIAAFLILAGLIIDGAAYLTHRQGLQYDLDIACVAAGDFGEYAFWNSLSDNDVGATVSIEASTDRTFRTTAREPHTFYMGALAGWSSADVVVKSRCLRRRGVVSPIAVQEQWYLDSVELGTEYPILGQGADATIQPGNDFPGAVLTQVWCLDGAPCEARQVFEPIPQDYSSASCQPYKDVASDTLGGEITQTFVPVGTHIPHIAGVSNSQLVKTVTDAGWEAGTEVWVMVFDGTIYQAANANCDNLQVAYYAKATVTFMDTNTVKAVLWGEPVLSIEEVLSEIRPRTVPWNWEGSEQ